ncbi:A disintegrin and metalloproteinase with thrombospondin motifs 1-like [Venturia canescens]|uniref:A disintegrin and metalloproteinase with thrombospondin motifs 1-like n=1 Tax=Venturia canescens TaxID=32260 RepID=UPI001C9D3567|nr:A disintegrin and metalloproteinase with thrombospondin motifs 1-like [Venturia canescens]
MLTWLAMVFGVARFVDCVPIHKHMTRDEISATFQNGHGPVPDYEVVSVYHTPHKHAPRDNSIIAVRVNAFEREMSLYLEPNDGVLAHFSTPVWTVAIDENNPGSVEYTRLPDPFANIGRAYHDARNGSAVVAYEGIDGETLILGHLNSDLIIRPLPHRLHKIISKETKSDVHPPNSFGVDGHFRRTHRHVVFKKSEHDQDSAIKIVKHDKHEARFAKKRSKRSLPEVIYPEILVVVDFTLFAVLNQSLEETTRYVLALWNAVDLRYRLLAEPAIRLNIAGIIISLESGGTAYLDDHRRGTTELDADLALTAMSHYFYNESSRFNFSTYDMAIALTQLDMCNVIFNDVCDTSTLGYAYEYGACNRSHVDANTEAVGIVEDNGGFKGIVAAAHEIAHLMGVSHDGFEEAESCPGFGGFIMSSFLHAGENSFVWSECSLRNLHAFLSSDEATCLLNEPPSSLALPRLLPGKLLTLDQQCEQMSGTRACRHDESVCTRLECYIPGRGELCHAKTAAAEGSYCGFNHHCINGHCVLENSTFVPYSSSTTILPPSFSNGDYFQRPRPNFLDE